MEGPLFVVLVILYCAFSFVLVRQSCWSLRLFKKRSFSDDGSPKISIMSMIIFLPLLDGNPELLEVGFQDVFVSFLLASLLNFHL